MSSRRRCMISQFACVSRATLSRICLTALAVSKASFLLLRFKRLSDNSASGVIAFKIVFWIFCILRSRLLVSGLILDHISGLTLAPTRFSQFWGREYLFNFSFSFSSLSLLLAILFNMAANLSPTGEPH